jgi:hypothetical protein
MMMVHAHSLQLCTNSQWIPKVLTVLVLTDIFPFVVEL